MTVGLLTLGAPGTDGLEFVVADALGGSFGEALATFAGETTEVVDAHTAEIVLAFCPAPDADVGVWEKAMGTQLRERAPGAHLTLLYSGSEGWNGANTAAREAARRLSPHPVRLLSGQDQARIEADLLGAMLTRRPPLRTSLTDALRAGSDDLLTWPRTLPDGTFVERGEAQQLEQGIGPDTSTTRLLIGPPGSGKSSLLAEIGARESARGRLVVAVKADAVPAEVRDAQSLGEALGLPFSLTTAVGGLRMVGTVVVLVDQLDAVSALLDVQTSRLDALLGFVTDVAGLTGVHVIASTRPFERMYDTRLRSVEADDIELGTMPLRETEAVLEAAGLAWLVPSAGDIETPWALDLILRHPPETGASLTLAGVLRRHWQVVVDVDTGGERRRVAERVAADIAREETFWIDEAALVARVRVHPDVVGGLIRDGVLVRFPGDMRRVGFRHQTLYSYALARALAAEGQSLADHVLGAKREGLFVRQTLLATLEELRESDGAAYEHELGRLLGGVTRLHLRLLLIRWLGAQRAPTDWERARIAETLASPDGARMLVALSASPASVEWLADAPAFLAWMGCPPTEAEPLTMLLRAAARDHAGAVRGLLTRHWVGKPAYDVLVDEALSAFETYTLEDVNAVVELARRGHARRSLHRVVEKAGPSGALRVLRASLDRRLAAVEKAEADARAAAPSPLREWWNSAVERLSVAREQAATWLKERRLPSVSEVALGRVRWDPVAASRSNPSYDDLFGRLGEDWRSETVLELATATPALFLDAVWPWVLSVLKRMPVRRGVERIEYDDRLTLTRRDRVEPDRIADMLFAAVGALAERDPQAFRRFASENMASEEHLTHALIAFGYSRAGAALSSDATSYLVQDPRRLTLGDLEDAHRYTKSAMQTVFESADAGEQYRLESAIVGFQMYPRPIPGGDPKDRQQRLRYEAQHRLRLLRGIPPDRRSARVKRLLQEGERQFPGTPDWDMQIGSAYAVGPRVGSDALAGMSDDDLLALFDEYDDTTGWDSPRERRRGIESGGVVEQSRAFRALAVREPARVESLMERLDAGRHQTYAAEGLGGLVESGISIDRLTALVVRLDGRGFSGAEFRDRVASALGTAAEAEGLPDAVVALLKEWLLLHESPPSDEIPSGTRLSTEAPSNPVSFGMAGFLGIVPHGRGYITEALLKGYLNRTPPDDDAALGLLESRLPPEGGNGAGRQGDQGEPPLFETNASVWAHAMMHAVQTLNGDRERATAVFDRVFAAFPSVWRLPFPPRLVAIGMSAFAPAEKVETWLRTLARSAVPYERHLYGELLMIARTTRKHPDYADLIRALAANGDLLALRGLGLAAAEVWGAPHVREEAATVLEATVRRAPPAVRTAEGSKEEPRRLWDGVDRLLWREKEFDGLNPIGLRVLAALAERPDVTVRIAEHVVPHVERLVGPDSTPQTQRVAVRLATGISDEAGRLGSSDRDRWAARRALGDLTSVALTIHRSPEADLREAGLNLFESLLDVDPYTAQSAQRAVDSGLVAGDHSYRDCDVRRIREV